MTFPDITTLRYLQARVREANGPDRKLDEAFRDAFVHIVPWCSWGFPAYTDSLDAAVALVERVLPGWAWSCGSCSVTQDATLRQRAWFAPDRAGPDADLLDNDSHIFDNGFDGDRRDGNPALALLDCLCQALIAKAERSAAINNMVSIGQELDLP